MYDNTFLNLYNTGSDIGPYIKWAARMVIAYGHFYSSSGVGVGMYGLTYSLYHTFKGSQPSGHFISLNRQPEDHSWYVSILAICE